MIRFILVAATTAWLVAPLLATEQTSSPPWTLSCRDSSFGGAMSAADLQAKFGAGNVTTSSVDIGEGEEERGTILFSGDSSRRVQIRWRDTLRLRDPAVVTIAGSSSRWKLSNGIQLGTTLRELERMNGRPFSLLGFAFDGSGLVLDWRGGTLGALRHGGCRIVLRLDPGAVGDAARQRWYDRVVGDRAFQSSDKAMHVLNPRVVEIVLNYLP